MTLPQIMGIVNATPDSFSDGGMHRTAQGAVEHGLRLLDEGADIIDVGGESTRPGADPVPVDEELRRVLPVVEGLLVARPDTTVSIDTRRAQIAAAALRAGASMVNDVSAGGDEQMAPTVAAHPGVRWVLMHMRGEPATMQHDTGYDDLVGEVETFLEQRVAAAEAAGIARHRLIVDPGLGFGKSMHDNPVLVRNTSRLTASLGLPVLVGASRKRFIGELTGQAQAARRVFGSVGVAIAAAMHGAAVLRVHDVAATREALLAFEACR